MLCPKHPATQQAGGVCQQCEASLSARLVYGLIVFFLALFVFGLKMRASDLKAIPPTDTERLALSKLANAALAADRDHKTIIAQIGLDKLKALDEAFQKQQKAYDAYSAAVQATAKKAGCSLDADYQCIPEKPKQTIGDPPKK